LGYVGLVSVPLVTSSPQAYAGSTELTDLATALYENIQQISGGEQMPSLATLQSYGLDVHFYGTDDSLSVVEGYYNVQMDSWNLEHVDSGRGWTTKIWRNMAYGFGFMGAEHILMKSRTGYNTIYMTIEGPATAWAPLLSQLD
ncbi:unnamed protein product, partial [marine sediment metagenome]